MQARLVVQPRQVIGIVVTEIRQQTTRLLRLSHARQRMQRLPKMDGRYAGRVDALKARRIWWILLRIAARG